VTAYHVLRGDDVDGDEQVDHYHFVVSQEPDKYAMPSTDVDTYAQDGPGDGVLGVYYVVAYAGTQASTASGAPAAHFVAAPPVWRTFDAPNAKVGDIIIPDAVVANGTTPLSSELSNAAEATSIDNVPPDAVTHLAVSRNADTLTLSWDAVTEGSGLPELRGITYNIYRVANGTPIDANLLASGISILSYTDSSQNIIGDVANNYFYAVKAVDGSGHQSASASGIVGEFDLLLHTSPDTNYTWMSVPVELDNITTAEELADLIGDECISVGKFEAVSQSYITHVHGLSLFNFAVEAGQPYRIEMSEGRTVTFTGKRIPAPQFTLRVTPDTNYTWIVLPFSKAHITTAEELADDIGDKCLSVGKFDPQTQSYITHIHGFSLFNFSVQPGSVYRIEVTEEIVWQ